MASKENVDVILRMRDQMTAKMKAPNAAMKQSTKVANATSAAMATMAKRVLAAGLAYMGFRVIYRSINNVIKESLSLAAVQIDVEDKLRVKYGESADALIAYAAERQEVTRIGDEATIAGMNELSYFNLSAKAVRGLIPLMHDMSEAKIDMKTSGMLLGRAMTGEIGLFSRYGIVLNETQKKLLKFGTEEERVAALTDVLSVKYGGLAEKMRDTVAGEWTALNNAVGDFKEGLGSVVLQSDAVRGALSVMTTGVTSFTDGLDGSVGIVDDFAIGMVRSLSAIGGAGYGLAKGLVAAKTAYAGLLGIRDVGMRLAGSGLADAKLEFSALKGEMQDLSFEFNKLESQQTDFAERSAAAVKEVEALRGKRTKVVGGPLGGGGGGGDDETVAGAKPAQKLEPIPVVTVEWDEGAWREMQSRHDQVVAWGQSDGDRFAAEQAHKLEIIKQFESENSANHEMAVLARSQIDADTEAQTHQQRISNIQELTGMTMRATALTQAAAMGTINEIGTGIADTIVDGTHDWAQGLRDVVKQMISIAVKLVLIQGIYSAMPGGAAFGPLGFLFKKKGGSVERKTGGPVNARDGTYLGGYPDSQPVPVMAQRQINSVYRR